MNSGHLLLARHLAAVGLAILTVAWVGWDEAEARAARQQPRERAVHGPSYRPPYAAIVVDDNSGEVLHAQWADDPRHPASLTKIMTLYLLFEQLEAGKIKLDTPLPISNHAVVQRPVKLGLKVNQTLMCEDAIKGLVTKSANDAAAVVAEAIAGSEKEFAKLMTRKARALGMMSRLYQCVGLARRGANHHRARSGHPRSRDPTSFSRVLPIFCDAELPVSRDRDAQPQ